MCLEVSNLLADRSEEALAESRAEWGGDLIPDDVMVPPQYRKLCETLHRSCVVKKSQC